MPNPRIVEIYEPPLTSVSLLQRFSGTGGPTAVAYPAFQIDLTPVEQKLQSLTAEDLRRPSSDRQLAPVIHSVMKQLPKSVLLRPGFWQWLCVDLFQDYTWLRWWNEVPTDKEEALSTHVSKPVRFLGGPTLNGMSRQAFARLFWPADLLWTPTDQYGLVDSFFTSQDIQLAIADREIGLVGNLARAFVRTAKGLKSKETQILALRWNERASTLAIEAMSEQEIIAVMPTP